VYNPLTKALMRMLLKRNINIYQLINKFKKDAKWGDKDLPEEVVQRVCRVGLEKDSIESPYPWFLKVLKMETGKYFANKNIEESKNFRGGDYSLLKKIFAEVK